MNVCMIQFEYFFLEVADCSMSIIILLPFLNKNKILVAIVMERCRARQEKVCDTRIFCATIFVPPPIYVGTLLIP